MQHFLFNMQYYLHNMKQNKNVQKWASAIVHINTVFVNPKTQHKTDFLILLNTYLTCQCVNLKALLMYWN